MALPLTFAANLLVGACIGMTGIAGFLLPIFYVGVLGLAPVEALALSFAAFLVSGALGTPAYRATGDLPLREAGWLSLGSLVGAVAGVLVGLVLPAGVLTTMLYLVVLCSGVSVLVRMRPAPGGGRTVPAGAASARPAGAYVALGAATAVICAATGAGGPVLVVPILMLMGFTPRAAVGVGLLDSVAIAVPSTIGYFIGGAVSPAAWALVLPAVVGHGIGVVVGSRNARRINPDLLKAIVAAGSVGVAAFKLAGMLLG